MAIKLNSSNLTWCSVPSVSDNGHRLQRNLDCVDCLIFDLSFLDGLCY